MAFVAFIGGMLFIVEEGVSFYNLDMLWCGFLVMCMGVFMMYWFE